MIYGLHLYIENLILENENTVTEKKRLGDLVSALEGKKLKLHKSYMKGICSDILQAIENKVKNASGHNMIWIRGFPSIEKSVLATSISIQLHNQNRHVISFYSNSTQSTMITIDTFWHVIIYYISCLCPSFCQYLVKHNKEQSSSNIDHLFKNIIEIPLFSLDDVLCEKLPLIVIDVFDKYGGLRHDLSTMDNYKGFLHIFKHWVQADYLKKFKLVIASWLEVLQFKDIRVDQWKETLY